MSNCKNCNHELNGNYCSNCGQPATVKRLDSNYIKDEIRDILHFEKGFFYTVKELLIRPGRNIREYISGNRKKLVKPITFLIVTSLIYTLIVNFFHIEEKYLNYEPIEKSVMSTLFRWIQANNGYANIIMGFIIAYLAKFFFRKYGYNYFELLVLLFFVSGIEMFILSFFSIIEGFANINIQIEVSIIITLYSCWVIGHFFQNKAANYFKAFLIYILGYITFIISAIFIGLSIDLIIYYLNQ